ncbi:MAG: hypothetical protein P1U68_11720 [Verrucomicrobiales bacterium]|nr:hypothetical protein [Verrucomicrobiales bacterium]
MFRCLFILIFIAFVLPVKGELTAEMHLFTDKNGKQILASLISVAEDKRTMKIRREDGLEFDLVINILSLDDQQFVKEQLQEIPEEKVEYRLEMDVAKKLVTSDSHDYETSNTYTVKEEFSSYVINLRNLSRETLSGAKVEWVIAWDDKVRVFESEDEWTYSSIGNEDEKNLTRISGEFELSDLPFNQDAIVTTNVFEIEEVFHYRDIVRADEIVGVIVRVVSGDGSILSETSLGGAEIDELAWDGVIALREPKGS